MAFRPKMSLLGGSPSPPGQYYEDTLENFLRPRLDKVPSSVVVLDTSGGPPAPHTQEANEETEKSDSHT